MRRANRQVTDKNEIHAIIDEIKVARLGMYDGEQVYVVPLNHGYELGEGEEIIFYLHCAKVGRKIDILKKNPNVCLELDGRHCLVEAGAPCDHSYYFASLIGNGKVEFVEGEAEKAHALAMVMKHQTGKTDWEFDSKWVNAVCILKVVLSDYTVKQHKAGMRK
ncbi:MAG: pyridoxamine 5'-phosphate oxidase family protein [Dorea sp.]